MSKKVVYYFLLTMLIGSTAFLEGCRFSAGGGVGVGYGRGHDGHGRWHRHHGPPMRRGWDRHNVEIMTVAADVEMARLLEKDYGLKTSSAMTIAGILVSQNPAQELKKAGIAQEDLAPLKNFQAPSQESVARIAKALDEDQSKVKQVLDDAAQDLRQDSKDQASTYWQQCFNSGHWSTPQNSYCRQTYWSGCSPEMGATDCYLE